MTQAADLIEYLLARRPGLFLVDRRSGLPFGWSIWIRSLPQPAGRFDASALTATAAQRPRAPAPGIAPRLSWLQAFRRLWWQHWEPRPRDQRLAHWLSVGGSALLHLLFALLLVWVAIVQWARPDTDTGDEGRVQLAFLGRGTPADGGGGGTAAPSASAAEDAGEAATAAQTPVPRRAGRSAQAAAAPSAPAAPPAPAPQVPPAAAPEATTAASAASVAPQAEQVPLARQRPEPVEMSAPTPMTIDPVPLQATATPVATTDFVVPPPPQITLVPREVPLPAAPAEVREREVQALTAQPQLPQMQAPTLPAPRISAGAVPQVREREVVEVPQPSPAQFQVKSREVQSRLAMPELAVRQAELPDLAMPDVSAEATASQPPAVSATPPAPPAATAATESMAAAAQAAPAASSTARNAAASPPATSAPAAATAGEGPAPRAGSGPASADRRDGWAAPQRADDWSVGAQQQGGARAAASARDGLFNGDGSVRLHDGAGQAAAQSPRGAPGSETDTWSRDRIAESGTWLKRPPYDYAPTSFDQYWVPSESLLEEWVRKGIKSIEIAIPGTSTRISCVVSLLQFGGGCGLTDPNKNDQPAQARPPPDIPFKKDLQEDNGALR